MWARRTDPDVLQPLRLTPVLDPARDSPALRLIAMSFGSDLARRYGCPGGRREEDEEADEGTDDRRSVLSEAGELPSVRLSSSVSTRVAARAGRRTREKDRSGGIATTQQPRVEEDELNESGCVWWEANG